MKNILVALVGLTVIGCVDHNKQTSDPHKLELDNASQYYNRSYSVYTLEGCEYIVVNFGNPTWGSHKGNCKNPIHYTK